MDNTEQSNKRNEGVSASKTVRAMVVSTVGKILSFVRTAICAAIYGATGKTDAFYLATNILSVLSSPTSSLATVIVPTRAGALAQGDKEGADRFTASLINIALIVAVILCILAYTLAPIIVRIFAPNFQGEIYTLAIRIVRILSPLIIVATIISAISGILNAQQRFATVYLGACLLSIVWMGFPLFLASRLGIYAMVWGYGLGTVLQLVVLAPAMKNLYRHLVQINWKDIRVRQSLLMCIPVFLAPLNLSVSRAVATTMGEGSVSVFGYATQLVTLVESIIILPIITSVFTALSSNSQRQENTAYKSLLTSAVSLLSLLLLPVTIYGIFFHREIVVIVFQRGAFGQAESALTSRLFLFFAMGFLPNALSTLMTRCFYSLQDTRIPLAFSLLGIVLNLALSYLLVSVMGIGGLSLSISIVAVFTSVGMILALRKKIGPLNMLQWVKNWIQVLPALAVLLVCVLAVRAFVSTPAIIQLVIAAVVGLFMYVLVLFLCGQPEVRAFVAIFLAKIKGRRTKE